jgi:hypothetical protein
VTEEVSINYQAVGITNFNENIASKVTMGSQSKSSDHLMKGQNEKVKSVLKNIVFMQQNIDANPQNTNQLESDPN